MACMLCVELRARRLVRIDAALRPPLGDARLFTRFAETGVALESRARVTPEAHPAFPESGIARWRPILTAAGEYAD